MENSCAICGVYHNSYSGTYAYSNIKCNTLVQKLQDLEMKIQSLEEENLVLRAATLNKNSLTEYLNSIKYNLHNNYKDYTKLVNFISQITKIQSFDKNLFLDLFKVVFVDRDYRDLCERINWGALTWDHLLSEKFKLSLNYEDFKQKLLNNMYYSSWSYILYSISDYDINEKVQEVILEEIKNSNSFNIDADIRNILAYQNHNIGKLYYALYSYSLKNNYNKYCFDKFVFDHKNKIQKYINLL